MDTSEDGRIKTKDNAGKSFANGQISAFSAVGKGRAPSGITAPGLAFTSPDAGGWDIMGKSLNPKSLQFLNCEGKKGRVVISFLDGGWN